MKPGVDPVGLLNTHLVVPTTSPFVLTILIKGEVVEVVVTVSPLVVVGVVGETGELWPSEKINQKPICAVEA